MSIAEVDALPWWQRRMYIECMNEEFVPPEEPKPAPADVPVRVEANGSAGALANAGFTMRTID